MQNISLVSEYDLRPTEWGMEPADKFIISSMQPRTLYSFLLWTSYELQQNMSL